MDAALKNPNRRRGRKDAIDLEQMADEEVNQMRERMIEAARLDNEAKVRGKAVFHKAKLLPEVLTMLNKQSMQAAVIDPDTNLCEAVRFFIEPLSDASMPAYSIQKGIFEALLKLPLTKEALIASGVGKVVVFYTKTKWTTTEVKRMAEQLVAEYTRIVLRKKESYKKVERQMRPVDWRYVVEFSLLSACAIPCLFMSSISLYSGCPHNKVYSSCVSILKSNSFYSLFLFPYRL